MDKAKNPKLNHQLMPIDPELDPIVEILRLAYRRGLALQRQQKLEAAAAKLKDTEDEIPLSNKNTGTTNDKPAKNES